MPLLDQALEAVDPFRPLDGPALDALLKKTAAAGAAGQYEPFKTSSIFDSTAQNLVWLGEEPKHLTELMPA